MPWWSTLKELHLLEKDYWSYPMRKQSQSLMDVYKIIFQIHTQCNTLFACFGLSPNSTNEDRMIYLILVTFHIGLLALAQWLWLCGTRYLVAFSSLITK